MQVGKRVASWSVQYCCAKRGRVCLSGCAKLLGKGHTTVCSVRQVEEREEGRGGGWRGREGVVDAKIRNYVGAWEPCAPAVAGPPCEMSKPRVQVDAGPRLWHAAQRAPRAAAPSTHARMPLGRHTALPTLRQSPCLLA